MDLSEVVSDDEACTPPEKDTGMIPPASTKADGNISPAATTTKQAGTIPPALTKEENVTIQSAPIDKQASTTDMKPTDHQQHGTPRLDQYTNHCSECSSSDHDTEDDEYINFFKAWLGLNQYNKRMLDNKMKMLVHQQSKMVNKAIPIF